MSDSVPTVKRLYRNFVPVVIRRSSFAGQMQRALYKMFPRLEQSLLYDHEYFARDVEDPAVKSTPIIAASIMRDIEPQTAIDVGCGTGALLAQLKNRGCRTRGLEYSEAGRQYCQQRGLDVHPFDLERDRYEGDDSFDLAISMEVAEHLPDAVADRYVGLLTQFSRRVVFTAAVPGQGGVDHVNEQPRSYWIKKFADRGYKYNQSLVERWRDEWSQSGVVAWFYYKNLMIFER